MIFTLKNVSQLNVAPQACVTPDRRIQIVQLGQKLKPNGLLMCLLSIALANDGLSCTGSLFLYLEQNYCSLPPQSHMDSKVYCKIVNNIQCFVFSESMSDQGFN